MVPFPDSFARSRWSISSPFCHQNTISPPFVSLLFHQKTGDQRWQRTIPQFVEDVPATYAANEPPPFGWDVPPPRLTPTGPTGPVASLQRRTGTFGIEVLGRGGDFLCPIWWWYDGCPPWGWFLDAPKILGFCWTNEFWRFAQGKMQNRAQDFSWT